MVMRVGMGMDRWLMEGECVEVETGREMMCGALLRWAQIWIISPLFKWVVWVDENSNVNKEVCALIISLSLVSCYVFRL